MKKWFLISKGDDTLKMKELNSKEGLLEYFKKQISNGTLRLDDLSRTFIIVEGVEHIVDHTVEIVLRERED